MIKESIKKGMPFNIIHVLSGNKIDFFPAGNDEYFREQLKNRKKKAFDNKRNAYFASVEDVIIRKLDYYLEGGSEKHIEDIKGILENSSEKIDIEYIDRWAAKRGTSGIWKKIKRSEEHTSELQSHSFISYAVFCLKKKKKPKTIIKILQNI